MLKLQWNLIITSLILLHVYSASGSTGHTLTEATTTAPTCKNCSRSAMDAFKQFAMELNEETAVEDVVNEKTSKATASQQPTFPRKPQLCGPSVAKTTIYFLPDVLDYCPSSAPCKRFRSQVRMQGSGILPGNKLLTYSGKVIRSGQCNTAFGASGKCLTPFLSVAADPRHYRMGDIISMPGLKGTPIKLVNGRTMIHPGYLIVQDTGGAIKGVNRFDFFTGTMGPNNPRNVFGHRAPVETHIADKRDCSQHKKFTVIKRGTSAHTKAYESMRHLLRDQNISRVASN